MPHLKLRDGAELYDERHGAGPPLVPDAQSYVLPDGGHFFPNVHGGEFRRVMTSFLSES